MSDELVAELTEKAAADGKAEFIFETTVTDEAGESSRPPRAPTSSALTAADRAYSY